MSDPIYDTYEADNYRSGSRRGCVLAIVALMSICSVICLVAIAPSLLVVHGSMAKWRSHDIRNYSAVVRDASYAEGVISGREIVRNGQLVSTSGSVTKPAIDR